MAATTAGALKALIEGLGLGISAYRDRAPEGAALPYVTIVEGISLVPDGTVTAFEEGGDPGVREVAQVSLWQQYRDPVTNAITESFTLPPALIRGLHGAVLTASPTHAFGCRMVSALRLLEEDENLVHHPITVRIDRIL